MTMKNNFTAKKSKNKNKKKQKTNEAKYRQ